MSPTRRRRRQRRRTNIYGRRRSRAYPTTSGGRGSRKNRYAHIVSAVLVVAVVAFVLTRDESDPVEATTSTTGPTVTATTQATEAAPESVRSTTPEAGTEETAATTTPDTTTPDREPPVLNESATAFVDALAEVDATLAQLVSEITAANEAWENRGETGARFEDTEAILAGIIDRTRALSETTADLPVPAGLAGRHEGPGGLVELATRLVALAEAVLDGLRLPSPDDGTTRRDAVAGFVSAAGAFASTADDLISDVEEQAEDLELTLSAPSTTAAPAPTTTSAEQPRELSEEALSYINGLRGFKQVLADLVALAGGANRDWDNSGETGVTYRETAAALNETIDRARSFHEQVRRLAVPVPVGSLGDGPVQNAARLPAHAEAMLEGLRIPAPEDGSIRRAALADFEAAAEDFAASVDNLVAYVEENASSLGLVASG